MTADLDRFACDDRFPGLQIVRLMRRAIESTRLDLKGLRVLTEASVGYRRITPVLAALAGADEVYAVGRDTVGGLAQGGRGADGVLRRARSRRRAGQAPLDAPAGAARRRWTSSPTFPACGPSTSRSSATWPRPPPSRSCAERRTGAVETWTSPPAGGTASRWPAWTKRPSACTAIRRWPCSPRCSSSGVEVAGSTVVVAGDGPAVRLRRAGARPAGRARARRGAGDGRPHRPVRRREGRRRPRRRRASPAACPRRTPWCSARPTPSERRVGPGAPDGRGAPRGGRAAPRRGGPGRRERPACARRRRPALPAGRRPRRHLRPAAAGRGRPARRRPQGRRGDDAGAAARLVSARRRAARRRPRRTPSCCPRTSRRAAGR